MINIHFFIERLISGLLLVLHAREVHYSRPCVVDAACWTGMLQ